MTLDEFKNRVDGAVDVFCNSIKEILEEASKEKHDDNLLLMILQNSMAQMEKKMTE